MLILLPILFVTTCTLSNRNSSLYQIVDTVLLTISRALVTIKYKWYHEVLLYLEENYTLIAKSLYKIFAWLLAVSELYTRALSTSSTKISLDNEIINILVVNEFHSNGYSISYNEKMYVLKRL